MKISLVIPAYNEESYIGDCLAAAIEHSKGRFHEIIVVDNASKDRTAEIARSFPGVRVVREDQKGLTKARQCGLDAATGDLIAYIDADTRLPAQWIKKLDATFKKHPEIVCLSGPYRYYDGSKWRNSVMHAVWWLSAPVTYWAVGYMVLGGNFIARKSALLAMGGFDRSIDFYGEDTDIARRLSAFGKVKFDMSFFIYSSSRRFSKEGLISTNVTYALNFIWQVIFHKPYTGRSTDIRIAKEDQSPKTRLIVRDFSPKTKTIFVSALFAVAGIAGAVTAINGPRHISLGAILPYLIFYATLTVNTYFSIGLFASIYPEDGLVQRGIDGLLVFLYTMLAFSFAEPIRFNILVIALFIVATLKYAHLRCKIDYPVLLRKKIRIDLLGVCMGVGAFILTLAESSIVGIWSLAVIFGIANIYLLFIEPMYRIEEK